jgi:hypothetical protein
MKSVEAANFKDLAFYFMIPPQSMINRWLLEINLQMAQKFVKCASVTISNGCGAFS